MLNRYLHKRKNSQNWQARMMIPKAARAVLGRREFTCSLGVSERKAAEERALPIITGWISQIRAVAPSDTSVDVFARPYLRSVAEYEELAVSIGFTTATAKVRRLIAARASSVDDFRRLTGDFSARHEDALRNIIREDYSEWEARARTVWAKRGWRVDEQIIEFDAFVKAMARAGTDTFAKAKAILAGNDEEFMPSKFTEEAIERRISRAANGEKIAELFDKYAAHKVAGGRLRIDKVNQARKIVAKFSDFVGADRSVKTIKPTDVRDWRDLMARVPAGYWNRKENRSLSLRELAERASNDNVRSANLNSINKYLSTISPLFDWCRSEGYMDHNPCSGLFFDIKKGLNRRPPFNVEQLNVILQSPLFNGFARDGKEHQVGQTRADDWRY